MPEMLIVCARIEAKKDKIDFVKSEVVKLVKPTRKEKGCVQYILHQDIEHPEVFIFFEKWEDDTACEIHMKNSHTQKFVTAINGFVSKIEVSKLKQIC